MPSNWHSNPELIGFLGAFLISLISGTISIGKRIIQGHAPSFIWVVTEYLTAILCGTLMYHTYPYLSDVLPEWATRIMLVALAAHSGGRVIQELEYYFIGRWERKRRD